jgi:hypothetical protein
MTLARLLVVVLVAAAALVIIVRVLEPRFAFFPLSGESTTPREFGVDYEALTIETSDGERLRAWHLRHPEPRALIVYFHGNGGNLSVWAPILAGIARHGCSVVAFDYRGYGLSTGRPSERGLYRDVDAVLDQIWNPSGATNNEASGAARGQGTPPAERAGAGRGAPATKLVIFWGRSLGTTMAAYAAAKQAPAGLILESGFPDARSLFRASPPLVFLALFSTYRFSTAGHLKNVASPVLVMHGDADSIIPFEHGRALFEKVSGRKEFFTIRGGDHNDAAPPDQKAYWAAVNAFIGSL